jgi:hypothetical protein
MRAILLGFAGVLALGLLVGSCGNLDTVGGHYPGMRVYEAPDGSYHLHYADPPWTEAETGVGYGSLAPVLVAKAVYLGVELDLEAYLLQVDPVACVSAAAAAASDRALAVAAGEVVTVDLRDLRNTAGDEGSELITSDGSGSLAALLSGGAQKTIADNGFTVRARRVYFPVADAAGTCFRVLVLSVYDLDEPDLTFMLRSFEPRGQDAAAGGACRGAPTGRTLLAAVAMAAGLGLTPGPAAAEERDEPAPMPEPSAHPPTTPGPGPGGASPDRGEVADLPDYGPRPAEEPAVASAPAPRPATLRLKRAPRLKLVYHRYTDHKIGGEPAPFNVAALTFYPLSEWVRLGCSLRFGIEDGHPGKRSWFLDILFSAGLQWLEAVRGVTPFAEFSVGPGFRMYTTFNNSIPSLQWSFGVDGGLEVYLGGRVYLTGAIGWTRPVVSINRASLGRQSIDVYGDTWILKVGLGI